MRKMIKKRTILAIFCIILSGSMLGLYIVRTYFLPQNAHMVSFKDVSSSQPIGSWSYEFLDRTPESLVDLCVVNHLQFLYLSINAHYLNVTHTNYNATYTARLVQLLELCNAQNIDLHIMTLQDSSYCDPENHAAGLQLISEICAFQTAYPQVTLTGIHLDVEPHTHEDWTSTDWTRNNQIFDDWLDLLSQIRTQVSQYNLATSRTLKLSAAVGYWYNERFISGDLQNGSAIILHQYLDFLVPMVYGGIGETAAEIISCVEDEIGLVPIVIGIGYQEFESTATIIETINAVDTHFQAETNYNGIAFFHSRYLIEN